MYLRIFKINVTTYSSLLQKLNKESSTHITSRRNDEHEQTFKHREKFKSFNHLIDENQFINSIFAN